MRCARPINIVFAGAIAEKKQPRFSTTTSMPALCESLRKAAYDPRIAGLFLNIDILDAGWAKVQELQTHVEFFKKSGKPTIAYMKRGGEKEYYLACLCDEIYVPPTAQLFLRGLSVQGQFLRGVLDKVGVEPQVCGTQFTTCRQQL
jgi:protease IV